MTPAAEAVLLGCVVFGVTLGLQRHLVASAIIGLVAGILVFAVRRILASKDFRKDAARGSGHDLTEH